MRSGLHYQLAFLAAILAAGMLLAAHVPLHDYEAFGADDHHESSEHQHPMRTLAIALFSAAVIAVAFLVPVTPRLTRMGAHWTRASASTLRCDDDIGLHDLLSVYRI